MSFLAPIAARVLPAIEGATATETALNVAGLASSFGGSKQHDSSPSLSLSQLSQIKGYDPQDTSSLIQEENS